MARSEFVRVSMAEKVYGGNHLLQSQLELLSLVERFRKYKDLRLQELGLKVKLKAKLEEFENAFDKLRKMLPVGGYHDEHKESSEEKVEKRKENLSLHEEVERIRRKIERLGH